MARKRAIYSGLQYIPTFFTDTSAASPDVFIVSEFPPRLTAGKNLFKLKGNSENLKLGVYVDVEVLDSSGAPIYSEVIEYITDSGERIVSIHVYEDTPTGEATVTLLSELSQLNDTQIPNEWKDKPNVKWTRSLPVNPISPNESEIIFTREPTVTIAENIGIQLDRTYATSQFPTYSTGLVEYFSNNDRPILQLAGGKFTGEMQGGTLTVTSPVSLEPTPTFLVENVPYVSKVQKVLSNTTLQLETPYTVFSSQSISAHTYNHFSPSSYTLKYEADPTYVSTQHSESFALVQIKQLEPDTGDISRIKVHTNTKGNVGTWELVNDVLLSGTEIFVDSTSSLTPDLSIGIFTSQSIIDAYWEGHTYLGKTESTAPTLTWTTSSINNGMLIDSSTDITANNKVLLARVKDQYTGFFVSQSEYKVTLDALATRSSVSGNNNPKLSIYASGSAFNYDTTDLLNQDLPIKVGKKVGEIVSTGDSQRYDDIEFEFKSDKTGNGSLLFVVEAGVWQIADIRTLTNAELGYTPNYTRIRSEIPTKHKSDNQLSFKIEYYNIVGNRSETINYVYDKNWQGGNRYIDGGFSMITGSLYVGDYLRSGVEISGLRGTGYLRSIGYGGFANATGSFEPTSELTYNSAGNTQYRVNATTASFVSMSAVTSSRDLSWAHASRSLWETGSNQINSTGSSWLFTGNYGHNIPLNAQIDGIEVYMYRRQNDQTASGSVIYPSTITDRHVYLTKDTSSITFSGADSASDDVWTRGSVTETGNETKVYGGSTNNWGQSWTPAEINATNFGVQYQGNFNITQSRGEDLPVNTWSMLPNGNFIWNCSKKITQMMIIPSGEYYQTFEPGSVTWVAPTEGLDFTANDILPGLMIYAYAPSPSSSLLPGAGTLLTVNWNNSASFGSSPNAVFQSASVQIPMTYVEPYSQMDIDTFGTKIYYSPSGSYAAGFLLWSGSAMPEIEEEYKGVGLEIVANENNYLRFRTDPSELDIHTEKFFIGNPNSQYISGSDGNLEMSASNFQITSDGSVSATDMTLKNYAAADIFVYSIATIDSTNAYASYYEDYVKNGYSASKLILDGSKLGKSATQVRIEYPPNYPLGMVVPPLYDTQQYGTELQIESGTHEPIYIAYSLSSKGIPSAGYKYGFYGDEDDWFNQLWQVRNLVVPAHGFPVSTIQYGTGAIGDIGLGQGRTMAMNQGQRIAFIKSKNDFRPMGITSHDWSNGAGGVTGLTNFYSGLACTDGPIYIGGGVSEKINPSAALQVDSTSKGFLPPRMTEYQRDNGMPSPPDGMIIWNSTADSGDGRLQVYCSAEGGWINLWA